MISYRIDRPAGLLKCRAQDGISVLDVANHLQALLRDPEFTPGLDALITVVDLVSIPPLDMVRYLRPLISGWAARGGEARWALVLPNEVTRVLAETARAHLPLHQVEARCFLAEAAALEWLGVRSKRTAVAPAR